MPPLLKLTWSQSLPGMALYLYLCKELEQTNLNTVHSIRAIENRWIPQKTISHDFYSEKYFTVTMAQKGFRVNLTQNAKDLIKFTKNWWQLLIWAFIQEYYWLPTCFVDPCGVTSAASPERPVWHSQSPENFAIWVPESIRMSDESEATAGASEPLWTRIYSFCTNHLLSLLLLQHQSALMWLTHNIKTTRLTRFNLPVRIIKLEF